MLTKITFFVAAVLVISGANTYATPVPGSNILEAKAEQQQSVIVSLCVGVDFIDCYDIPLVTNHCFDFNEGRTILNKSISSLVVPDELICNLFQSFSCLSDSSTDVIALPAGSYANIEAVQTDNSTLNFNDQASSIQCYFRPSIVSPAPEPA